MLSSKTCSQCKSAKALLNARKIKYTEVDIDSEQGQKLFWIYPIMSLPYFIKNNQGYALVQEVM